MTRSALVTKHGKLALIRPSLREIGWSVDEVVADTDVLGSFTGEPPRRHPALEAARRKALLARGRSDAGWFLASEGTFTSIGGLTVDRELVIAVDSTTGHTVAGWAQSVDVTAVRFTVGWRTSDDEIIARCADADLPRHRLMVTVPDRTARPILGLADAGSVVDACRRLRRRRRTLEVGSDLRAHLHPSRQRVIALAASDLAGSLACPCPACGRPGFSEAPATSVLPCEACGAPTATPAHRRELCRSCGHEQDHPARSSAADPTQCGRCNP